MFRAVAGPTRLNLNWGVYSSKYGSHPHISAVGMPHLYYYRRGVCVCVCAKFDQFLPVRPHFDTKRPVNFFHIATFPSPTFGPLFAFHCPLFFTKNNNLHAAMF